METFIDWINSNLTISGHPLRKPMQKAWWNSYDVIINMSDFIDHKFHAQLVSYGKLAYWFPTGESFGIPLENVYGALSILYYSEINKLKTFIHCMAGRNRSVMIVDCYYYLRSGKHRPDNSNDVLYGKNVSNKMFSNINDNQLPGIYRMEKFLEKCIDLFDNPKIAEDAYVDWLKKETFGY
jgi:hypothetical protein